MERGGERLAERLKALGMSQSALARHVGITQSAINHMIKRGTAKSPHVHKIARVLETTPEYLNFEIDDPSPGAAPVAPMISPEELELLRQLRHLAPGDQETIMRMTTSLFRAERRLAEDAAKLEDK